MDLLKEILSRICLDETVLLVFPSARGGTENQMIIFPEMKERLERVA